MSQGPAFIERSQFEKMLQEVRRVDGRPYEDVTTIYGDMSRLVVAWLSRQTPEDIMRIYNELGWNGAANGRALHEAAKHWMEKYHPDRARKVGHVPH